MQTNADVDNVWVAALSNEQVDDSMPTNPSEEERDNYGNDADVVMTIARSDVNGLIAEKGDFTYAERTQAKFVTQIEEIVADMLQLGNHDTSSGIKSASARFLDTIVM